VPGARQRPQRGDQRHVRELAVAEVDAVADEHERVLLTRLLLQLGEQARLADARLARDEGERRPAVRGIGERSLELGQLGRAADEP
jgi:hypothetical protein